MLALSVMVCNGSNAKAANNRHSTWKGANIWIMSKIRKRKSNSKLNSEIPFEFVLSPVFRNYFSSLFPVFVFFFLFYFRFGHVCANVLYCIEMELIEFGHHAITIGLTNISTFTRTRTFTPIKQYQELNGNKIIKYAP